MARITIIQCDRCEVRENISSIEINIALPLAGTRVVSNPDLCASCQQELVKILDSFLEPKA